MVFRIYLKADSAAHFMLREQSQKSFIYLSLYLYWHIKSVIWITAAVWARSLLLGVAVPCGGKQSETLYTNVTAATHPLLGLLGLLFLVPFPLWPPAINTATGEKLLTLLNYCFILLSDKAELQKTQKKTFLPPLCFTAAVWVYLSLEVSL